MVSVSLFCEIMLENSGWKQWNMNQNLWADFLWHKAMMPLVQTHWGHVLDRYAESGKLFPCFPVSLYWNRDEVVKKKKKQNTWKTERETLYHCLPGEVSFIIIIILAGGIPDWDQHYYCKLKTSSASVFSSSSFPALLSWLSLACGVAWFMWIQKACFSAMDNRN